MALKGVRLPLPSEAIAALFLAARCSGRWRSGASLGRVGSGMG